jgi:uracil phosphoribosyltransferase
MIKNLSKTNTILNRYIAEIRDEEIQKDSMRFRKNLERISWIFGYEISKTFKYEEKEIVTPLGTAHLQDPAETPLLVPILRAGLPMHHGLQQIFDRADSAFVSAYRKAEKKEKFIIKVEYISAPDITDRILILADPMLATGASIVSSYKALLEYGKPAHTHIVVAIASIEGIEFLKKHLPGKSFTLWVGAIDEELTAQAYIVPGLGDAGDLAFGKK